MKISRTLKLTSALALLSISLTGCASQTSAPPAPPPATAAQAVQNNPGVNKALQDSKPSSAAADYIKTHMPANGSGGTGNGR